MIHKEIEALGFKRFTNLCNHTRYKRRNVEITVQEFERTNIYVEVHKRGYDIELTKHGIEDVNSTIKLIKKFIKKEVGR
jgi:hypothetical protein